MSEKACNTCAQILPFSAFNKHKGRADGYLEICRKCRSEARKAHYAGSAEERAKVAEKGRVYYAANKDVIAPKKAAYTQQNKEAHNERGRNWYHANLEKARGLSRAQVARYRQTEKGKATVHRYYLENFGRFQQYRTDNAVHIAADKKRKYELNKPAILAQMRAYYASNKAYILTRNKVYFKGYAKENPEKLKAWGMVRRLRVAQNGGHKITGPMIAAIWHKQAGLCVYCRAKLGDNPKSTGAYHVDHIHPVSKGGTNEPHNLQCLCPHCNFSKGAKLPHVFAQELGRLFF